MEQVFTILYEDSTPARKRISFYNTLAANSGLQIRWLQKSDVTNGYEQLQSGEADAILISGAEDFQELKSKGFTVVISQQHERRLVALFAPSIKPAYFGKQYSSTYPLIIAADFEWQSQMAANFLAAALPIRTANYQFTGIGDGHSFDERLAALIDGRVDIAILTLSDLNLSDSTIAKRLKYMVLPLFECPPNIYQATTGLVLKDSDAAFTRTVKSACDPISVENYLEEASMLNSQAPYSAGVFHMNLNSSPFTYLARPEQEDNYELWKMDAVLPAGKKLFSSTDYMKDFFRYEYLDVDSVPDKPVSFIASHKSVHNDALSIGLGGRRVWAAGSKTWFELAKKGIWVEGSSDGLGLETLTRTWAGNFLSIEKDAIEILTNVESANHWSTDGWSATGTYKLIASITPEIIEGLEDAEIVFWTSYQQYQACRGFIKPGVIAASPAGKTSALLRRDNEEHLVVFPSIKAFNWYRSNVYQR
ncbi:MAG: hypothetical protein EOO04_09375 [Chitinophagaceae bacterium]|nr:MAG: hypothetical protein EOO04_09375 [Chitinophagaceae bacterium]